MTSEIDKSEWQSFFDSISQKRLEWQTKIEVLQNEIGAQVLSEGLPLMGVVFTEKDNGKSIIEIITGESSGIHQTHTISNPEKVFFEQGAEISGGTIEIEEQNGAKTIIYFAQPISVLAVFEENHIMKPILK